MTSKQKPEGQGNPQPAPGPNALKSRPHDSEGLRTGIGSLEESRKRLGNLLEGKKIVLVVDDSEHRYEAVVFRFSILEEVKAAKESTVMTYSELLAGNAGDKLKSADALLLRSSRLFTAGVTDLVRFAQANVTDRDITRQTAGNVERIMAAIASFREKNPDSVVIICAYTMVDCTIGGSKAPISEDNKVRVYINPPSNDFHLLETAADMLGLRTG